MWNNITRLGSAGCKSSTAVAAREQDFAARKGAVVAFLASLGLQQANPTTAQIDINAVARQMLALHLCNPAVRDYAWSMATAEPFDIQTVLTSSPMAASFGQPQSTNGVPTKILLDFFDIFTFGRWTIDEGGNAIVPVTRSTAFATIIPLQGERKRLPTEPLVKLFKVLRREFGHLSETFEANLKHDLLLLYFASSCLIEKNGRDLVFNSYYLGPELGNNQLLREKLWKILVDNAPPVCLFKNEGRDSIIRVAETQQTWGSIMLLMANATEATPLYAPPTVFGSMPASASYPAAPTFVPTPGGQPAETQQGPPPPQSQRQASRTTVVAQPGSTVNVNPAPPADEAGTEAEAEAEEEAEPETGREEEAEEPAGADDDQQQQNDDGPDDSSSDSAAAAAGAPEDDQERADEAPVDQNAAPPPPPRDDSPEPVDKTAARILAKRTTMQMPTKQVGAAIGGCPYHQQKDTSHAGFCPVACVEGRVTSYVKRHLMKTAKTPSGTTYRKDPQSGKTSQYVNRELSLLMASIARNTPSTQELIMSELCSDAGVRASAQAGHIKPVDSPNELAGLIRSVIPLQEADAPSNCGDMGNITKLATYGGWANRPIGEQVARYVAVYASPKSQMRSTWMACGYEQTPRVRAAIEKFREANPEPSLRDHQAIAAMVLADVASAQ